MIFWPKCKNMKNGHKSAVCWHFLKNSKPKINFRPRAIFWYLTHFFVESTSSELWAFEFWKIKKFENWIFWVTTAISGILMSITPKISPNFIFTYVIFKKRCYFGQLQIEGVMNLVKCPPFTLNWWMTYFNSYV